MELRRLLERLIQVGDLEDGETGSVRERMGRVGTQYGRMGCDKT